MPSSTLGRSSPDCHPSATIVHYGGASATFIVEQRPMQLKGKLTLLNRH